MHGFDEQKWYVFKNCCLKSEIVVILGVRKLNSKLSDISLDTFYKNIDIYTYCILKLDKSQLVKTIKDNKTIVCWSFVSWNKQFRRTRERKYNICVNSALGNTIH